MKKLFDFLASYGFAVVLLILLTILTLFGTLEQAHSSLFDVQNKYFNSFFLVHYLFGVIPVPLPGVYLLTALLLVNLTCGGSSGRARIGGTGDADCALRIIYRSSPAS